MDETEDLKILTIKAHVNNLSLDAGASIDTNWNPTSS